MKPYAKYVFEKLEGSCTRYILTKQEGLCIHNFPATWKRGENKGKQYIIFRETQREQKAGHRYFSHTISLDGNRTFTGINFNTTYPLQVFGDAKSLKLNDAVMIRFSENGNIITMLFYQNMAEKACSLYEKWTAGTLPETVEENMFLVNHGIKKTGCIGVQPV